MLGRTAKAAVLATAAVILAAGFSRAVDYPRKRINMTILFGAGAGADLLGRKLSDMVSKELGQDIVCTNRLGGGGATGYQYVLNQAADGYNICWNSTSVNVVHHLGNMKQDYAAFDGVCNLTKEFSGLAVRADAPWKTIQEFIEYAKANPGEATVANSGVGSFNHLVAAALEDEFGITVKHIPLNANESITALLGGKVDAVVNMTFDIIQRQQAGSMRCLIVVGDRRLARLPGAPTTRELGLDFELAMWRGVAVRKGTPPGIVDILEKAFIKAAMSDEFKDFADRYGVVIDPLGAKDFDRLMADSDETVAAIIDKLGIRKK